MEKEKSIFPNILFGCFFLSLGLIIVFSGFAISQYTSRPYPNLHISRNRHGYVPPPPPSPFPPPPPFSMTPGDSEYWKPKITKICQQGYSHTAPCIADDFGKEYGKVVGYEFEYRDFELALPSFCDLAEEGEWQTKILEHDLDVGGSQDRAWPDFSRKLLRYFGQHGQTFTFENRVGPTPEFAVDSPFSKWDPAECMGKYVPHNFISPTEKPPTFPLAIYSAVPDSHSWQHFLDRVTHVLLQAKLTHELNQSTQVLANPPRVDSVREMYSLFNLPLASKKMTGVPHIFALPCRTPLIHPYFSLKLREVFLQALHVDPTPRPLEERKIIYYAPRGSTRKVLNEKVFLRECQIFLDKRGKGEKIMLFHSRMPLEKIIPDLYQNCRGFLGAHGGAFYNARWCPKDSLVMEFIPTTRPSIMFFEESQILNHNYYPIPINSPKTHDVTIPIEKVIKVFEKKLGQTATKTLFPSLRLNPPTLTQNSTIKS